jgi:hypothetical protein
MIKVEDYFPEHYKTIEWNFRKWKQTKWEIYFNENNFLAYLQTPSCVDMFFTGSIPLEESVQVEEAIEKIKEKVDSRLTKPGLLYYDEEIIKPQDIIRFTYFYLGFVLSIPASKIHPILIMPVMIGGVLLGTYKEEQFNKQVKENRKTLLNYDKGWNYYFETECSIVQMLDSL